MIIKVSRHRRKPQRRQISAPRSVKVLKAGSSQEEKSSETTPQPSLAFRRIKNVRPLTPSAALLAWSSMFEGIAI